MESMEKNFGGSGNMTNKPPVRCVFCDEYMVTQEKADGIVLMKCPNCGWIAKFERVDSKDST